MSYSTANPPFLVTQGIGNGAPSLWNYNTADADTTIRGAGYITNGGNLGMKVGDLVIAYINTGTITVSSYRVVSVAATGTGAVDLSDGTVIGSASNT